MMLGPQQPQLVRKGIVARSDVRFAAGVGIAAFLLILGPCAAVAIADPGGSGSHSNRDDRGNRSDYGGNRYIRGGPNVDGPRDLNPDRILKRQDNGPRTTVGSGRSGDRPGSGNAGVSTASPSVPVVVGNGRSPDLQDPGSGPPREYPVAPPPPPPAPVMVDIPPPLRVDRTHVRPVMPLPWTDPLFGLAGLVLIPAAGVALGYRQARAAQAAQGLGGT